MKQARLGRGAKAKLGRSKIDYLGINTRAYKPRSAGVRSSKIRSKTVRKILKQLPIGMSTFRNAKPPLDGLVEMKCSTFCLILENVIT